MNDWFYPKISDYWDQQVNAIAVSADKLRALSEEQREHALSDLGDAVLQHTAVLSDRYLINAAVCMADDLYKASSVVELYDEATGAYLRVTAGTLGRVVAERGFEIRYAIDNTYEPTEFGLTRPLVWYPIWFKTAGFAYICPQHVATMLMEGDGIEGLPNFVSALSHYIDEARVLADTILVQTQAEHRHYLFLDTDSIPASLDRAIQSDPNALAILRNEAPEPGSQIQVSYPASLDN